MIAPACPVRLRGNFPFPEAAPAPDVAWMDQAPQGQRHFVCPRQRGEAPICRLEMKFPGRR
eukprot:1746080-Pyramimonas_sp.AAC.1